MEFGKHENKRIVIMALHECEQSQSEIMSVSFRVIVSVMKNEFRSSLSHVVIKDFFSSTTETVTLKLTDIRILAYRIFSKGYDLLQNLKKIKEAVCPNHFRIMLWKRWKSVFPFLGITCE